jgi:hypothetical protein
MEADLLVIMVTVMTGNNNNGSDKQWVEPQKLEIKSTYQTT